MSRGWPENSPWPRRVDRVVLGTSRGALGRTDNPLSGPTDFTITGTIDKLTFELGPSQMTAAEMSMKIPAFAAVAEAGTGLVLLIDPAIVVTLLLGAEISGVGTALGRCFGIALLALGLACWPGGQRAEPHSPAVVALLLIRTGRNE